MSGSRRQELLKSCDESRMGAVARRGRKWNCDESQGAVARRSREYGSQGAVKVKQIEGGHMNNRSSVEFFMPRKNENTGSMNYHYKEILQACLLTICLTYRSRPVCPKPSHFYCLSFHV